MSGHGYVVPNVDGLKARCGGPAICSVCAKELHAFKDSEIERLRARVAGLEAALCSLQVAAAEALALLPDEASPTHSFLSAIHRHAASALANSTAEPVNEKLPAPPKVAK